MDTMGALALATEDPNPDLLKDKVGFETLTTSRTLYC
jgi:hypothetical protein